MPIDFNKPTLTDNYSTEWVPNLQNAIRALGMMLDPAVAGSVTNPLNGLKRLNSGLFEQFNGTSWVEYAMSYAKKAGDTFSGGVTFQAAITGLTATFAGTTSNPLAIQKTNAATNLSMAWTTTGGTVYAGYGAAGTFAVKGDTSLDTSPWFRVSATSAAILGTSLTVNGQTVWHAGNDGAGSGLDADLLDGLNSTAFAQLSGATFTGQVIAPSLRNSSGYFEIQPYGATYDDGSKLQTYWDGNGRLWSVSARDSANGGVEASIFLTGDMMADAFESSDGAYYFDAARTRSLTYNSGTSRYIFGGVALQVAGLVYGRGGGVGMGRITLSTSTPGTGAAGDIHLQY